MIQVFACTNCLSFQRSWHSLHLLYALRNLKVLSHTLFHPYFPDEEVWSGKWYGAFIQKFKVGIFSAQPCGGQAQPLWISSFLFWRESQELDGLFQV